MPDRNADVYAPSSYADTGTWGFRHPMAVPNRLSHEPSALHQVIRVHYRKSRT